MATFTWTSQRTGNWNLPSDNASSPWHDGSTQTARARYPDNPGADRDKVVVAASHAVTIPSGIAIVVGDNASGIGHGITLNGTNSTTFGELIVAGGGTLTLKGFDRSSNTMALVNRYAKFRLQPGATLLGDIASDGASLIDNRGYFIAEGSSGSHITIGVPSGNRNWNNSVASDTGAAGGVWDVTRGIYVKRLANPWVSNAAGTGIGSLGDTSLSLASTGPAGALTTEVATVDDITSAGHFCVDYKLGYICAKSASAITFTASYKRLTFFGWMIPSVQNTADHEALFDYCDFTYMGTSQAINQYAIYLGSKQSAAVAATRRGKVTNCTFAYCQKLIGVLTCTGTAGDPILIEDNTFDGIHGDST
jgi:hypothetical protein